MCDDEENMIWNNYLEEVKKNIPTEDNVVLFDDSVLSSYPRSNTPVNFSPHTFSAAFILSNVYVFLLSKLSIVW